MNNKIEEFTNDYPPFLKFNYFEDFAVGNHFSYGAYKMLRAEMLDFAKKYDPEPFHLDADVAKQMGWPDLIASGPHVCAIWRRLSKDAFIATNAFVSPGWDEIRWLIPIVVGHVLNVQSRVSLARPLKSRPEFGLIKFNNEIQNQYGQVTTTLTTSWFVKRRSTT